MRAGLIERVKAAARHYKRLPAARRRAAWMRISRGLLVVAGDEPQTEWDLQLANALDRLHSAIADGADEAVLHAANELDRIEQALSEQAARVRAAVEVSVWPWVAAAAVLLIAVGYARRDGA